MSFPDNPSLAMTLARRSKRAKNSFEGTAKQLADKIWKENIAKLMKTAEAGQHDFSIVINEESYSYSLLVARRLCEIAGREQFYTKITNSSFGKYRVHLDWHHKLRSLP